jgi:hypothetical protein
MAVTLHVKCGNEVVRIQRESVARRVLDYFGNCLPTSRLLCFLDDTDAPGLKLDYGVANRGGYIPVHDNIPLPSLPEYVTSCIFIDDGISIPFPRVVDDLVYLHGSTCNDDVGLTITLAHELQHVIQHATVRKVWAVNGLVMQLRRETIVALKLTWADVPIEREARIVSKRIAAHLFGERHVEKYIDHKITERVTEDDASDWQFVRTLTPSSSVDLLAETKQLFNRLRPHRQELEHVLRERKDRNNPDFCDIDLRDY